MKRSNQPILAERVFRLTETPDGWRLQSTATPYTFAGPIARDDHAPWTADERAQLASLFTKVAEHYKDDDGDDRTREVEHLNVPEWEMAAVLGEIGMDRLSLWRKNKTEHVGFHAFRPGKIMGDYNGYPVVGEVELFGRVVEYERGYRAQGVRIKRLRLRGIPERDEGGPFGSAFAFFLRSWGPPSLPKGDPAQAPKIVADLEAAYQCDVVEEWQQHRTADPKEQERNLPGEKLMFWSDATTYARWQPAARTEPAAPTGTLVVSYGDERLNRAAPHLLAACEAFVTGAELGKFGKGTTYALAKAALAIARGDD